jgi:hypothetical protein
LAGMTWAARWRRMKLSLQIGDRTPRVKMVVALVKE